MTTWRIMLDLSLLCTLATGTRLLGCDLAGFYRRHRRRADTADRGAALTDAIGSLAGIPVGSRPAALAGQPGLLTATGLLAGA